MSVAIAISDSTSLSVSQPSARPRVRVGWIVNPWVDLCCFIGGALTGYGVFFLHAGLGWDIFTVWFVWYITLDVPHFFGTYARTYLDREELRRRGKLLWGSLAWLLLGPAVIGVQYLMYQYGNETVRAAYQLPFLGFYVFVSLWAYWHVVRQHYGIMALYKRKNQDLNGVDQLVDKLLLYGGLLAPFVAMVFNHPEARFGFEMILDHIGGANVLDYGGEVSTACLMIVIAAAAAYLTRQAYRLTYRLPINLPKLLFLLAVVPLHVFVCYHPATLTAGLLGFGMFVTIFHDVQYHAIIWHYQRNRYCKPGDGWAKFGPAAIIGRYFPVYVLCALAMGFAGGYFACLFDFNIGCTPIVHSGSVVLFGDMTLMHLLTSLMFGFLMLHYFVDQYIWRPSKDPELRRDLKMTGG